ncbi:putative apoptosis regulator bax [Fasciola hepatica]|uniref:Apoptosis regulator bax n=1 Tax=Fasciola hepatica TaxID=6192 RepID=A0A4E0RK18_FASHE|nr:putative apoptosis regulator bax [Fasciola hepatica]
MISELPTEGNEWRKYQSEESVVDDQTQMIVEEFVQFKLKKAGKKLPRKSGPSDMDTQVLVGRLLDISNELEEKYGDQLNRDAERWMESATFDKFLQIAKGVFADGVISWSRIVVLFMFAVKVVLNALARNLGGLAGDVVRFVIKFIFTQGILKWVQSRGGWLAVLQDYGQSSSAGGLMMFAGLLVAVLFLVTRTRHIQVTFFDNPTPSTFHISYQSQP